MITTAPAEITAEILIPGGFANYLDGTGMIEGDMNPDAITLAVRHAYQNAKYTRRGKSYTLTLTAGRTVIEELRQVARDLLELSYGAEIIPAEINGANKVIERADIALKAITAAEDAAAAEEAAKAARTAANTAAAAETPTPTREAALTAVTALTDHSTRQGNISHSFGSMRNSLKTADLVALTTGNVTEEIAGRLTDFLTEYDASENGGETIVHAYNGSPGLRRADLLTLMTTTTPTDAAPTLDEMITSYYCDGDEGPELEEIAAAAPTEISKSYYDGTLTAEEFIAVLRRYTSTLAATADPDAAQAAATAATPQQPVTVHVDWTHREGTSLTGLMMFTGLTPAQDAALTAAGREPQFLLTGGTRRKTIDAWNDYNTADQFVARPGSVADVAAQAATWLGITAPLTIHTDDETR